MARIEETFVTLRVQFTITAEGDDEAECIQDYEDKRWLAERGITSSIAGLGSNYGSLCIDIEDESQGEVVED